MRGARLIRPLLAALLLACDDGGDVTPPDAAPIAAVRLTPAADTLAPGERVTIGAVVRDSAGRDVARAPLAWSSDAPSVATVDSLGGVIAVAPGAATIAAVSGGVRGETRVIVRRVVATLEVAPSTIGLGETVVLQPILRDSSGVVIPAEVALTSGDPDILFRDSTTGPTFNRATARRQGTTTISATVDGRQLTARVTVAPPRITSVGFAFRDVIVPVGLSRGLDLGVFVPDGGRIEASAEWSSSDPAVVTVDANGVITGVAEGEALVTAAVGAFRAPVGVRVLRHAERPVFTSILAGERQTCALSTGGIAYCWGEAGPGASVLGTDARPETLYTGSSTWEVVSLPLPVRSPVRFASLAQASGARGGCALTVEGAAYCWNSPTGAVPVPGGLRFSSITVGFLEACGVALDGRGYCWQRGTGADADPRFAPQPLQGDVRFATLAASGVRGSESHVCGIDVDGGLHCWLSRTRTPVATAVDTRFRGVTVGVQTCAVSIEGAGYCWSGPSAPNTLATARVLRDRRVLTASVGEQIGCALDEAGATYCWPVRFGVSGEPQALAPELTMRALVIGPDYGPHVCGLSTAGAAYCWGFNEMGQLGLPRVFSSARFPGTTQPRPFTADYAVPTRVMGQP